MFKPEFIPRILLSLILFALGSSLLILANPPPPYSTWGIIIAVLLIGAGVLVSLIPSDKPIRQTGDAQFSGFLFKLEPLALIPRRKIERY